MTCITLCFGLAAEAYAVALSAGSSDSLSAAGAPLKAQAKKKSKTAKKYNKKAKGVKIKNATQWAQIGLYKKGGTFKVAKNIALPNEKYYLNITKNKKYTIDLNGHTVKTTYTGVPLRTVSPLYVKAGTVTLKTGKSKGMLYSTETAAVVLEGSSKFYMKSGTVVDNATEFRSDITSAIMAYGASQCYVQGKSAIQSIGNGIAVFGNASLFVTGSPFVRAGANEYKGQFTHYGSAVSIASPTAKASIKGGSFGTKASPDVDLWSPAVTMTYTQSGNYPILDMYGKAIVNISPGYKYVDSKLNPITVTYTGMDNYYDGVNAPSMADLMESLGYSYPRISKLATDVADANGYYTIYCVKA